MLRDYRKNKLFNRRTFILTSIRSFLSGLLVLRLGYLQLGKHKEYSMRSDSNSVKAMIQPALRGIIYDRNRKPLVANRQNYRLLLYLESHKNVQKTINELIKILRLDKETQDDIARRIEAARRRTMISLIDNLSWEDLVKVEVNSYRMPELSIEIAPVRYYPLPFVTAHVVGYVSLPNEKEIDYQNQNLFMHPNFKIGKSGIEKSFDKFLRGKFGIKYSEVNAFGLPIRTISTVASVNGEDLNLTIDLDLQKFVAERIAEEAASVVVMDIKTGEIISLNSSPSFDVNNFVEGFSRKYWLELIENEGKPMNNKPITANYPPGSVFKLMVALAALENGFNPNTKHTCNSKFRLGRRVFHCWKDEGHGTLDLQGAIKNSCNVYFFNVAKDLGIDKMTKIAGKFGYGQPFNVDLQEVTSKSLPSDAWKRKYFKVAWTGGDTLNASIGQGFMLASPIQIAVATARIANGGIPIKPYLVKNAHSYSQYERLKNKPIADAKHLEYVRGGMYRVINEVGGTAYGSRLMDENLKPYEDFQMAGKTGTSQVVSKREKEMTADEWKKNQNHAIFTGFAPAHDPRYAISVIVEHGGAGSQAAAPVARSVMQELKRLMDIRTGVATESITNIKPPLETDPEVIIDKPAE